MARGLPRRADAGGTVGLINKWFAQPNVLDIYLPLPKGFGM